MCGVVEHSGVVAGLTLAERSRLEPSHVHQQGHRPRVVNVVVSDNAVLCVFVYCVSQHCDG